jgi:hypothetical protein
VSDVLQLVETALVEHFGHRPVRASVSFVGVDPIDVLRFEPIPGERVYVSLGMSRHPMTGADQAMLASAGPRAELMLHLNDPTDEYADVWRRIALLAATPAVEGVVYGEGHSVEIGEPLVAGSACVGVLIVSSPLATVPAGDEEVEILQAVPATANELAWCRVRGSAALRERWAERETDLLDLMRRSVALD